MTPLNLGGLTDGAFQDHHVAFAPHAAHHRLGHQFTGQDVIRTDVGGQVFGIDLGVRSDHGDLGLERLVDSLRPGLDVDWHEDDAVELLGDHGVELVVLGQGVVVAVEHRELHRAVLHGRVLFQGGHPDLHEFGLQPVGCQATGSFQGRVMSAVDMISPRVYGSEVSR